MKKAVFFLLLVSTSVFSLAQDSTMTQTVRGVIIDEDSQTPLIGAIVSIFCNGQKKSTTTNYDGEYKIEQVPIGRQTIFVQSFGYQDKQVNILVSSAKEVLMNIQLRESVTELDAVVIDSQSKKEGSEAAVSARSFDVEETKRYAGSLADPARMASSFAGVATNPDGNNDIIVRGNSPRGVLWRIEGVEAPNPNHFSREGASGGPISVINSNMIANSNFYTGAFPSEFGNAYSGVFDINLRQGNNQKREYTGQVSVLGTELGAEGPFSENSKASYNVNYRYSTLSLLKNIGVDVAGSAVPKYQDATFKLRFPTEKKGIFTVYGIGGISGVNFSEIDEKNDDKEYLKGSANNKMGVLGVQHLFFIGKNTHIKNAVVYNGNQIKSQTDALNRSGDFFNYQDESLAYTDLRVNTLVSHKINAKHTLKAGINYTQKYFNVDFKYQNIEETEQQTLVNQSGNTGVSQVYGNWQYRPSDKLTFLVGLHNLHFHLNGNNSLEPRLGLNYAINLKHSIKAGVGVHSRLEPISTYYTHITHDDGSSSQANINLGLTKARHYVIGYENKLTKNMRLSVEMYYQDLFNVPVENIPNSNVSIINFSDGLINKPLVNKGTGQNYGMEITLERYFANHYYFLVTGSLYQSKYKALDGVERDTKYNGNQVLNVLAGKEFDVSRNGKQKFFTLSAKSAFAGGNRYTPIDLEASILAGEEVLDQSKPLGVQSKSYYRFDLQMSLRINKKKTTREWKLDVQNVTNNSNVVGQFYDPYTQSIEKLTQLGLLPVLSYKIEF